jgi:hypothetical protein
MRKQLSHNAYVRKLNRQMRRHPNYRQGMRVTRINGTLYEMVFGEPLDPQDPAGLQKLREDVDLQRVLWDSVSVIQRKYYLLSDQMRSRMLPRNLLFRMSKEGRRCFLLQGAFNSLACVLIAHRQAHGSWPADAAPLIQGRRLMDPWAPGQFLQIRYAPPKEARDGGNPRDEVVEYVTPHGRKFVIYADGHQETWRL